MQRGTSDSELLLLRSFPNGAVPTRLRRSRAPYRICRKMEHLDDACPCRVQWYIELAFRRFTRCIERDCILLRRRTRTGQQFWTSGRQAEDKAWAQAQEPDAACRSLPGRGQTHWVTTRKKSVALWLKAPTRAIGRLLASCSAGGHLPSGSCDRVAACALPSAASTIVRRGRPRMTVVFVTGGCGQGCWGPGPQPWHRMNDCTAQSLRVPEQQASLSCLRRPQRCRARGQWACYGK